MTKPSYDLYERMNKQMKKGSLILSSALALLLLGECAGDTNEETSKNSSENSSAVGSTAKDTTDKNTSTNEEQNTETSDATEDSSESDHLSENSDKKDDEQQVKDPLATYSSEQIEYARVWLQLGPNKDVDGLYVRLIPAGTPLNPDDETSAGYPEDVIQLAGSRLIDGAVTYSANGDGTINVYNVPLRWDGQYPAGEDFYKEIIENTKLVTVDTGVDEEIIGLIELIMVHDE